MSASNLFSFTMSDTVYPAIIREGYGLIVYYCKKDQACLIGTIQPLLFCWARIQREHSNDIHGPM